MQEGSFRCDANVSVRRPGAPLGTRREIKNLNSFRFLQQAIDFEVQWQIDRVEDGLPIEQATVLFNPDTGETRAMRSKEDAHDYRYFPDPDLPPLVIEPQWVERVRSQMPELPAAMAARFVRDDGLPAYDAAMMTQSLPFARCYEAVRDGSGQPLSLIHIYGAAFDLGRAAGHADDDARAGRKQPALVDHLDELLEHLLGDGEVGNHAILHRADRLNIAGHLAQHGLGFLADGLDGLLALRPAFVADGDDRGFVQHDALVTHVDQRVGGTQVDGKIG